MAEKVIQIDGVGNISFPDSMSDDDVSKAAAKLYQDAHQPANGAPSTNAGLAMAAAGKALPVVARGSLEFATSPTAPSTLSTAARGAVTAGAAIHGMMKGSPTEVLAAPMEGWAAGKGAYWLGRNAQSVATPLAGALSAVAPYAQILSTLGGAQGAVDLAQMAEPNRKDARIIGFGDKPDPEHPALINAAISGAINLLKRYAPGSLAAAKP